MAELRQSRSPMSSESEFQRSVNRMFSNWPVTDTAARDGKIAELRELFNQIGAPRFAAMAAGAITNINGSFFPPFAALRPFIPERKRSDDWRVSAADQRRIKEEQCDSDYWRDWERLRRTAGLPADTTSADEYAARARERLDAEQLEAQSLIGAFAATKEWGGR